MKEFSLNNSTGDILCVDEGKKEISYFRDPWGRDSSSIPDAVVKFEALQGNELYKQLEKEMYPDDWKTLCQLINVG